VFFDTIGRDWRYEEQGFKLPSGRCYLPDIFVQEWRAHIEIKPNSLTETEQGAYLGILGELEDLGVRTMLIAGSPWPGEYSIWRPWFDEDGDSCHLGPLVFAYDRRDANVLTLVGDYFWGPLDRPGTTHDRFPIPHDGLDHAYHAARGARFEHGECG